jgi:hypothetical protein
MSKSSGGGIGPVGVTAIVFIVLKLIGAIDWPWYVALSPLWISALMLIVFYVLLVVAEHHQNRTEN